MQAQLKPRHQSFKLSQLMHEHSSPTICPNFLTAFSLVTATNSLPSSHRYFCRSSTRPSPLPSPKPPLFPAQVFLTRAFFLLVPSALARLCSRRRLLLSLSFLNSSCYHSHSSHQLVIADHRSKLLPPLWFTVSISSPHATARSRLTSYHLQFVGLCSLSSASPSSSSVFHVAADVNVLCSSLCISALPSPAPAVVLCSLASVLHASSSMSSSTPAAAPISLQVTSSFHFCSLQLLFISSSSRSSCLTFSLGFSSFIVTQLGRFFVWFQPPPSLPSSPLFSCRRHFHR